MLLKEEKKSEGAQELRERLEDIFGKEKLAELVSKSAGYKDELVIEAEEYFADSIKGAMAVKELLAALDEEKWKALFAQKMNELSKAERDKDAERIRTLLGECQEISKKLAILYNNQHTK